ncbi:hypothetical protein [Thermicanus aegyptius]|uniref:hypothetical protein n=1 Tax=Thermicanus aegyptius TaxID=94009 RepID=UPI0004104F0A|nr:hypothetical protein [Thermicanus aegyptius]
MQVLDKRIQNRSVIQSIREEAEFRCEYVDPATGQRCEREAPGEPHHIRTRGAGGSDIRENLIQLCGEHHRAYHDGHIDRHHLILAVAGREGKTAEEIYGILGLLPQPVEKEIPKEEPEPTLEELISAYHQLDEQEQEVRWTKGQLLDAMLKAGAKASFLSSQLGVSTAQIRELVKVYRVFPEESTRIPSLSWYHHRIAANSKEPQKYIAVANDEGLSTRELRKKILEDEGRVDVVQEEEDKEMKKAERLFKQVEEFLASGGLAAGWLREQLKVIV